MSDDLEFLQRWRDGDKAAGEALARAHYREIFERLRRGCRGNVELAAELTQQVFEVTVTKREDIVSDFRRYLHGVARFKLWEHFRQRVPSSEDVDATTSSELVDPGHGAFSVMTRDEDAKLLVKALQSLSVEEQAYLMWSYADRLKHVEIAERVGLTATQVTGRIHRAREKLRHGLEELTRTPSQRGSLDKGFQTWMLSLRRRVDEPDDEPSDGEA